MRKYYIFLAFLFAVSGAIYSQTGSITNIQVSQQTDNSGLVDVYFDLSGPDGSYYLSMSVSFDGGTTFTSIGSNFLSEDIGPINPGTNKHIIWDGGQSFPDTYSTQSQLKIIASNFICGGVLIDDRDGKTYSTVQIGTQCWFAENLNYQTTNSWWHNNSSANGDVYGRLYTWEAALTACPSGWSLPSDNEWKQIEMELGMSQSEADGVGWRGTDEGKKLKNTNGWYSGGNGTDTVGFSALPGSYRGTYGSFYNLGLNGYWWSATVDGSTSAWHRRLTYYNDGVGRYYYSKGCGFSVRCVRD